MDYISVKEAAGNWGITSRMVNYHCAAGRIDGAQKIGNMWIVPKDAAKPADGRRKQAEKSNTVRRG
jgi:translation initiation factor IF-1